MTTDLNQAVSNVRSYMDAALSVGHTASQYRLTDGSLSFLFHGDLDVILAALSTPPADDVREALDHLDALNESGRIQYADYAALHDMVSRIEVRPRGTVTDAEALRFGKVAWVAYQSDKSWAESVVEDCFSPADDLPDEALDMIAVARAVLEAARGVPS